MRVPCARCGVEMSSAPDARIDSPSVFAPVLRGGEGITEEEIDRMAGFIEVYLCEECPAEPKAQLRGERVLPVSEWDVETIAWNEKVDPGEGDGAEPTVVDDDFEFIEDSYYVVTNSDELDLSDTAVFEAELVKAIHKQTDLGAS